MAFKISLDADDILQGVDETESWKGVLYKFGIDDEFWRIFFIAAGLNRNPGGIWEFYFHVIVRDVPTGSETTFWGGAVKPFDATADQRTIIRHSINVALSLLLERFMPETVDMVTRDTNLPESALEKFRLLGDVFRDYGYREICQEPFHGKKVWRFTTDPNYDEE